jgi:hypothetical protein
VRTLAQAIALTSGPDHRPRTVLGQGIRPSAISQGDTVPGMPAADDARYYWGIDIPGLTEDEAKRLAEWADTNQIGRSGPAIICDPAFSLTVSLDRASAQMLYDGLMSNPETASAEHGLAGEISDWLDWSRETS